MNEKKVLSFALVCAMAATTAVTVFSCSDNSGGGGSSSEIDGIGSDPSVVQASSVLNADDLDPDIATVTVTIGGGMTDASMKSSAVATTMSVESIVSAMLSNSLPDGVNSLKADGSPFPTGEFKDGKFKIDLPATVDKEYLYPLSYGLESTDISVSDPDVGHAMISVVACNDAGDIIGSFMAIDAENMCIAIYVYAEQDCSINGQYGVTIVGVTGTLIYNCSFKKGWNFMYLSPKNKGETVTFATQKPSGVKLQWMYTSLGEWE